MIDYLGKSVKSFYHNLSPEVKSEVDLVKIGSMLLGNEDSKVESTVIFLTLPGNQLNVYQMVVDYSIEFQCIYSNKFAFAITSIEPLNYINQFKEERPLIAIVSNTNEGLINSKKNHCLLFISIKNDNVLLTLEYPAMICSTCFRHKYFGVGLSNGTITVYNYSTLHPICSIDIEHNQGSINPNLSQSISLKIPKVSLSEEQSLPKPNKVEEGNAFLSYYPVSKASCIEPLEVRDSFSKQAIHLNQDLSNPHQLAQDDLYMPVFDLTENYIIYHINKSIKAPFSLQSAEPQGNKQSGVANSPSTAFDMAFGALKNLKEWSLKSINDYSSLLKSTNIKTNDEISKLKDTPLYICVKSLSASSEKDINDKQDKITVPFFKDGLSLIQVIKNGKYIIIGNMQSQLFFVYELYPQTNLKYSNEGQNYKIIYSLFRGNRSANITSIDITKSFGVITSERGSHHVYFLPIRDQQIIENLIEANAGKTGGSSSPGTDYLNQKITNGIEIATLRQIGQVFSSKIITLDKVYLDNSIVSKISFDSNSNSRFSSVIRNENFLVAMYDNTVEVHLLYNSDKMILLKKAKLPLTEERDVIKSNFQSNFKPEPIQVSKIQMNKRFLVETDTTDKNFSSMQTNPLFTFNLISSYQSLSTESSLRIECPIVFSILTIPINQHERKSIALFQPSKQLFEKNEIYLYESFLCKEQAYLPINQKQLNMESNNSKSANRKSLELYSEMLSAKKLIINPRYEENYNSIDIKNNFYNNKDTILETNIKNALETNIKDTISNKNSVKKPEDFVIQDNYYK